MIYDKRIFFFNHLHQEKQWLFQVMVGKRYGYLCQELLWLSLDHVQDEFPREVV